MGLLIIDPGLRLWGSERALLSTLPAVAVAHDRVVLMTPNGAELVEAAADLPLIVCEKSIGLLHQRPAVAKAGFVKDVAAACLRFGISRIHLNQAGPAKLVNIVAQLLGIPLVVHVRLRDDLARCAALKGSRRAPISLVFVSEDMRARYPKASASEPFKTLHTAYDPYPLVAHPPNAPDAGEPPFICVGRLAPTKGQEKLIGAVALARRDGMALATRLLGADACGGTYETALRDLARTSDVEDLVEFSGYRTDVLPFIARSRTAVAVPPPGRAGSRSTRSGSCCWRCSPWRCCCRTPSCGRTTSSTSSARWRRSVRP